MWENTRQTLIEDCSDDYQGFFCSSSLVVAAVDATRGNIFGAPRVALSSYSFDFNRKPLSLFGMESIVWFLLCILV